MKKKSTILAGLLLAVVVTGYSVAGTYAKYTGGANVSDTAKVAQFNVTDKKASFEIFNARKDSTDSAIIAPGYSHYKTFTVNDLVSINSDVPTVTTIGLITKDNASKSMDVTGIAGVTADPMEYALIAGDNTALKDADYKSFNDLVTELNATPLVVTGSDAKYTIAWRWADDKTGAQDAQDTALGNAMYKATTESNAAAQEALSVKLTVGVTVSQDTDKLNEKASN